jgi:hypothetical protein
MTLIALPGALSAGLGVSAHAMLADPIDDPHVRS